MDDQSKIPVLPNEIVGLIVECFVEESPDAFTGHAAPQSNYHPDTKNLKTLRLVNKAFHGFATPCLFRILEFGFEYENDVGRMRGLASTSADCLRHMKALSLAPPRLEGLLRASGVTDVDRMELSSDVLEVAFRPYFHAFLEFMEACPRELCWLTFELDDDREWWGGRYLRPRGVEPVAIFLETVAGAFAKTQLRDLKIYRLKLLMNTFTPAHGLLCLQNFDSNGSEGGWDDEHQHLNDLDGTIGEVITKARCQELIIGAVDSKAPPFTLPLTATFASQLQTLRLRFLSVTDSFLTVLTAATSLRYCVLKHLALCGDVFWGQIFDAMLSLQHLHSVMFEGLQGGGGDRGGIRYMPRIPIRYLEADPAGDRIYYLDGSRSRERPVDSDYQSDYDAMQRLVRKLLLLGKKREGGCSAIRRRRMQEFLLPHCVKTREWLKENDPNFKELLRDEDEDED